MTVDATFPAPDDRSARAASLRSRAAVEAGDRDGWLSLFTSEAVVADPVGTSPFDEAGLGHRGPEARAAFWDAVIGPNKVTMDIRSSHAGGHEVANVVTITTELPDGSRAIVDVVAIYAVDDEGHITSLRAFWEMDQIRFESA